MRILVIVHQPDAGPGVFAEVIADTGHRLELWKPAQGEPAPDELGRYAGVLTFGGGMHPDQDDAHPWLAVEKRLLVRVLEQEIPLLGVCLGAELVAEAAGGAIRRSTTPEIGWYPVKTTDQVNRDAVFGSLPPRFDALEWHSYEFALPPGAVALCHSEICLQAYRIGAVAWGVQFHAEVTLPIFESWLSEYDKDPDAVQLGVDPEALAVQTREAIGDWNRMGRELCTRFIQVAETSRTGVPEYGAG